MIQFSLADNNRNCFSCNKIATKIETQIIRYVRLFSSSNLRRSARVQSDDDAQFRAKDTMAPFRLARNCHALLFKYLLR